MNAQEFSCIYSLNVGIIDSNVNIVYTFIPGCENYVMSLRTFRDNLLHCNHSWTLVNSSLITVAIFCRLFPVKNILVSSANNIDMLASDTVDKSLMYIKKSNGPSIEPYGTPQLIFSVLDLLPLYVTYCFLLDK